MTAPTPEQRAVIILPRAVAVATRAAEEHATAGATWADAVHHMVRSLIDRLAVAKGLPAPGLPHPTNAAAEAHLDDLGVLDGWHVLDIGELHQQLLELTVTSDNTGRAIARKSPTAQRAAQGAWYTPPEVAAAMCRLSIGPQLDRLADEDPDPWNLLRICAIDPACGAGVFLVEAARLIAVRFAHALFSIGADDVSARAIALVLPDVMTECVFGIDIDPVAVDLAKAALWFDIDGCRPFTFLDRNVIVGNALDLDCPPAYAERCGEPMTALNGAP